MNESRRNELIRLRHHVRASLAGLEKFLLFEEAITMAHLERTGLELPDGGEYTEADEERARKIMELYPDACA